MRGWDDADSIGEAICQKVRLLGPIVYLNRLKSSVTHTYNI